MNWLNFKIDFKSFAVHKFSVYAENYIERIFCLVLVSLNTYFYILKISIGV